MTANSLSTERPKGRLGGPDRRRCGGIALLVVLIVFVVLYLVVYQLFFTTTMEERLAQVRYGEVEADLAQHSAALFVLTLLLEDLSQGQGGGAAGAAGAAGGMGGLDGALGGAPELGVAGAAGVADGGQFVPIDAAGAAGAQWFDYKRENIFQPNEQQIGGTTVKITMADGESRIDLNHLFDYVRMEDEELTPGMVDVADEDLVAAVEGGATDAEVEANLRRTIEESTGGRTSSRSAGAGGEGPEAGADRVGEDDERISTVTDDYELEPFFERPDEERIQMTVDMLSRTLLMLFSQNEDNGYLYSERYFPESIATAIVDYVLERRMSPAQNRVYLLSELLNIDGVTAELFYGPVPVLGLEVGDGFIVQRDVFGDIVPEYQFADADADLIEAERAELDGLLEQFGPYASFPPELGLDPMLANSLTRGMSQPIIEVDDFGEEFVVEPPMPLGLKDIFSTFSTGKININTAPLPVLFGLLVSLEEEEAQHVAVSIDDYRNRFQQMVADGEEGVAADVEDADAPNLGQPQRQPPPELDGSGLGDLLGADVLSQLGSSGLPAGALDQLSGVDAADLSALSSYQNLETNYFTNLQQLELADGTDGGPEDLLASGTGVERVDAEDDTLLRRAIRDYEKVAVFGSTHFDVEVKAKPEKGRTVKTGYLTVRREPTRGMIEILMWKDLEK